MNLESTIQNLKELEKKAGNSLKRAASLSEVEEVRVEYFGKKGHISEISSKLRDLDSEGKKKVGQILFEIRNKLEASITEKRSQFERSEMDAKLSKSDLDPTAPGVQFVRGYLHPIRQILKEAVHILETAGLQPVYGPEVEFEDYCFDKLNFKPGHAARDMQATFFVQDSRDRKLVLRTHTSPVQVRVLLKAVAEKKELPLRVQVPGRVYRMDDDSTHAPMFHQIEGLAVDRVSTMGDLRATLDYFFRHFFDEKTKVRFRPSYFPFTEPSAEVDISCVFCKQKGCRVCKQSGWLEVAGAGLVHPEVFELCGMDSKSVQGWAFGMGIERLAMLKLGISDLRLFFENRLSFLRTGEA